MSPKRVVVIGLLGLKLDTGKGPKRWNKWRPSVDLCRHDDFQVDRFELLGETRHEAVSRQVAADIETASPGTEVRLHGLNLADPWDFEEVFGALLDFANDYPFDPQSEDYYVHITTGTHVAQISWFLLSESRHIPGKLLQASPPRRSTDGDVGMYRVIDLDLSKYDKVASRFQREQREGLSFLKQGIDTQNSAFNALIEQVEHVAIRTRSPVLLTGPTGSGKTVLARRLYALKKQRGQVDGPFVEVNCATMRGDHAMSMLFGHAKGAFTGATSSRRGLLREADGGLLFLDEVGELGLDEQAMLLRAIEDKRFLPVGSDKEVGSDFQLVAGTNRELRGAVETGRFREDLLARLNLWTFELPGLAQRREDIAPNLEHELARQRAKSGDHITFNRAARDAFLAFAQDPRAVWSANFRDFAAAVERMATLAPKGRITPAVVDAEVRRLEHCWGGAKPDLDLLGGVLPEGVADALDRFDRVQLADVLTVCRTSRSLSEAGRTLFAESRKRKTSANDADRLRKYLARFELSWADVRG